MQPWGESLVLLGTLSGAYDGGKKKKKNQRKQSQEIDTAISRVWIGL